VRRPGPYCEGTEWLEAVLRRCRTHGPEVVVGFMGGMAALRARTMAELEGRPFKWDWADGRRGRRVQNHWLPGDEFAAAIDGLAARDDGGGVQPGHRPPVEARATSAYGPPVAEPWRFQVPAPGGGTAVSPSEASQAPAYPTT
jgi:hypothetical protein